MPVLLSLPENHHKLKFLNFNLDQFLVLSLVECKALQLLGLSDTITAYADASSSA